MASPALTGNPTAPTPTAGDNSTSIATTAFVTTGLSAIQQNKIYQGNSWMWIADTGTGGANLVIDGTQVLAATSSGVVLASGATATTQSQTSSDTGSGLLATTSYVKTATTWWSGSAKFVSTNAPTSSDGSNGDFWFQI